MTLVLTAVDHDDLCHGWMWEIENEDELVDLTARVAVGQYRHIGRILEGLGGRPPVTTGEHVSDAIRKLAPDTDGSTWRRDGWLFQIISWIAAHHNKGTAIVRAPHIRKADHGFDGLHLEMSDDGKSIAAVVICEDKATSHPRGTISAKIWPDFAKLEANERITDLTHDVTSLLETQFGAYSDVDIQSAVEEIIWKDARRYRISITVKDEAQDAETRAALFAGYGEHVGGPVVRRRAETIRIDDLRVWFASFADRVAARIEKLLNVV